MQSTSQRKRLPRWLPWLVGGLVLVLVSCATLSSFALWQLSRMDWLGTSSEDELTSAQLEQVLAVPLPSTATNVHSYYTAFQDHFVQVRFELPAADAPAFLASTPLPATLLTTNNPFGSQQSGKPWWQPHHAQRFRWGKFEHNNTYHTVLVDETDPDRFVVYWQMFDT